MTRNRKIAFAALTVLLVFVVLEGTARVIWWGLERKTFQAQESAGREILRNDAVAFMKVADGRYGYTMKPGFRSGLVQINSEGFHQKDTVPVERKPGLFRVVCLGESTTFGNDIDSSYPTFLHNILNGHSIPAEVINAGVPGWVSDQVALRAELELASYKPDVAILYVGWNDFQSYDPLGPEPAVSYWEFAYKGRAWKQQTTTWLRSVALLSAAYYGRDESAKRIPVERQGIAGGHYKFLFQNLDRIVQAFRATNPNTVIFVSTLVGRWPVGTAEEWQKIAPVWWMAEHKISVAEAPAFVEKMNDQLRAYARSRNLHLIDSAAAFDALDRGRLQFDWAHMVSDGYELLAWTMFDALERERVVSASTDERETSLRSQYTLTRHVEPAVAKSEGQ